MSESEYKKQIDEAIELSDSGNKQKSIAVLSDIFEGIPANDINALGLVGWLFIKANELPKALYCFQKAVASNPSSPRALRGLGEVYLELSEPEKAQGYFTKSLALEEYEGTLIFLGLALLSQDLITEARAAFTRAIKVNPDYEEAYYNLGATFKEENPRKAIKFFKKAIALDPEYAIAYRELGWALSGLNKFPQALENLNRALELDDADGLAYIYLGNTFWVNEDLVAAETTFKKAIAVWPEDSIGYWCLANFYECQERDDEAMQLYRKGIELEPDDVQTNLHFGLFLKEIGEPEKAKMHLRLVISLEPDNKRASQALDEII